MPPALPTKTGSCKMVLMCPTENDDQIEMPVMKMEGIVLELLAD